MGLKEIETQNEIINILKKKKNEKVIKEKCLSVHFFT